MILIILGIIIIVLCSILGTYNEDKITSGLTLVMIILISMSFGAELQKSDCPDWPKCETIK